MQEVEVTFARTAQIWWAWFWRTMLLALLFGFLAGFVLGLASVFAGIDPQQIAPFNMIAGALIGMVVSIWMLSKILKRDFGSFRIALIRIG